MGATAAGKSELALDLAEALGGEVVNTDAMQLYRGMDIGTAKLPAAQRRGVPHHLLDVLDITETASVAVFQRQARAVVEECLARGVVPVLVGGSALYTRAVLDTLDFPATDPAVRARLEMELSAIGPHQLHSRLTQADPEAARHIEPGNGRRIVRALEVVELTGSFRARLPDPAYHFPGAVQIGLDLDRPTLHERIEHRVDAMWRAGVVDEVRALAGRGLRQGRTSSRALGYRQLLDHLDGTLTEDQARAETVRATRRFARRQDAWFRKDGRVRWVGYDDPHRLDRAVAAVRP